MRFHIIACAITLWSVIVGAALPDDNDPPKPRYRRAVESLPELRWSLVAIRESRDWMQKAISFHEEGNAEKARLALGRAAWDFPRKSATDGRDSLDANAVSQLRTEVKELEEYLRMMARALDLHDKGEIAEAHRVGSEAASQFPDQTGARWFAEKTKDGQQIPAGASIAFINRTDHVISSVDLHYCRNFLSFSHIHHVVRDLKPGATQSVYTDALPKGSARLYVDLEMDVHGEPYGVKSSSRVFSRNSFGFAPTVIIEKDGSVSFSALASELKAEWARTHRRPSIEEKIEWQKKQDALAPLYKLRKAVCPKCFV
ncbi:MAG: hypothetical protein FJ276_29530 [Planctomycetes bacterium]|nr:hypothetical protein [Planctomycetota bacterium]